MRAADVIRRKRLLVAMAAVFMTACQQQVSAPKTLSYSMPKGMEDCVVHKVDGDGPYLYITRCPQSIVETQWERRTGKSHTTEVVIDGIKYVAKGG